MHVPCIAKTFLNIFVVKRIDIVRANNAHQNMHERRN